MRYWQYTLLAVLFGALVAAGLILVAAPPRGAFVELLPAPTLPPLQVHIDGEVLRPGVYEMLPGSRVEDAIEAAGGFTGQADRDQTNLAAKVKDGEKILVRAQGTPAPPAAANGDVPAPADDTSPTGPLNLNTASMEALQTLPGIGETRAKDIIQYREKHNGFKTIDEIQEVPGIGPATFERLQGLISVD